MSDLAQNPYFQRWISKSAERINTGLRGEQALTIAKSGVKTCQVANYTLQQLENPMLALHSERVIANLLVKLKKPG